MLELGRDIATQLPEKMTATECAKRLGISITAVLKIERLALAKLHDKLKATLAREDAEPHEQTEHRHLMDWNNIKA